MLPLLIMTTDMAMLNSCGNEGCRSPRVKTKLKRGFPSSLGLGDHLVDQLELRADVEEGEGLDQKHSNRKGNNQGKDGQRDPRGSPAAD